MKTVLFLFVILLLTACNPGSDEGTNGFNSGNVNNTNLMDKDGDGYAVATGDCNDNDPNVNPGVAEIAGDGIDNNCDGFIDNDFDGDGYPSPADCNDHDATIFPGAVENCFDGVDNNCNGYIDDEEPDNDGDGFSVCEGDCNDNDARRGPGAIEDPTDGVDNNCDGVVDEILEPCDCQRNETTMALSNTAETTENLAKALGICNSAVFTQPVQVLYAQSWGLLAYDSLGYTSGADGWGDIRPIPPRQVDDSDPELPASCMSLVLFTGPAWSSDPESGGGLGYECPFDPVTQIDNAEPDDSPSDCYDMTQVKLVLRVPGNVTGIAFDFLYLSSEYDEWLNMDYNDTFYAIMGETTDDATHINISFDGDGKAITVNNDYFEDWGSQSQSLGDTGYAQSPETDRGISSKVTTCSG